MIIFVAMKNATRNSEILTKQLLHLKDLVAENICCYLFLRILTKKYT